MKSSSLTPTKDSVRTGNGIGASFLRMAVMRQLGQLRNGALEVVYGNERQLFGDAMASLRAELHIHNDAIWGMVASNGSIGAGEAYIHGYWTSPDLTAVVRVFVSNLEVLDAMEGGLVRDDEVTLALAHQVDLAADLHLQLDL